LKNLYQSIFHEAYQKLNIAQKSAVDHIEGPVLCVAGPGTGKTELLAVRIGNILNKTNIGPSGILCLTYTEAGVTAMRQRLRKYIGPESFKVNIHTYHGFCNMVISENLPAFSEYGELQQIDDLQKLELMRKLIDGMSMDNPLKKLKGDPYREKGKLSNLFSHMKRENWSTEYIINAVDRYRDQLMVDENFLYNRRTKNKETGIYSEVGDPNLNKIGKEMVRYDNLIAGAQEFSTYQNLMYKNKYYDFDDMILWVLDKFNHDENLLLNYQERFQYILVDEYQDTNGSQNELLYKLANYWERPNLFVVGDDDQAIYRFQGANVSNIIDFKMSFDPKEIVLTENYRSTQAILDASKNLIEHNEDRLASKFENIDKNLHAAAQNNIPNEKPKISICNNQVQEEAHIIEQINELLNQGVQHKDIAIIYRNHKHAQDLIQYFKYSKIPFNLTKKENILNQIIVKKLVNLLSVIGAEYKFPDQISNLQIEIMYYDFLQINPRDIGRLSYHLYASSVGGNKISWRDSISNRQKLVEWEISDVDKILIFSQKLERWIAAIPNNTLQSWIEIVMTESGLLRSILHNPDSTNDMEAIKVFFEWVKDLSVSNNELDIESLLGLINTMNENRISKDFNKIYSHENGINLMTAHGSKGLEFDYVFMIKMTKDVWANKSSSQFEYSMPPTLVTMGGTADIEDERRLAYVAMTRAKKELFMSYYLEDKDGKSREPSQFIEEAMPAYDHHLKSQNIDDTRLTQYIYGTMIYTDAFSEYIDHNLIDRILPNIKLNPTGVSKFLDCPLKFYFENILRVPSSRTIYMGYGNAIHHALEFFFRDLNKSKGKSVPLDTLLHYFKEGMDKFKSHFTSVEYENHLIHGRSVLEAYYNANCNEWPHVDEFIVEKKLESTYNEIPISGRLDMIERIGHKTTVIDYKTSSYTTKKLKPPTDSDDPERGDQWRQMVMYKMLLDQNPYINYTMDDGYMDFVETYLDGKKKIRFVIDPWETELVGKELEFVYEKIKHHDFEPGCQKPDCYWCNFVNDNTEKSGSHE